MNLVIKIYNVEDENLQEVLEEIAEKIDDYTSDTLKNGGSWTLEEAKKPRIECGKTLEEYLEKFGEAYENGDLWDFSAEDVNGGAVDLDPDVVYWEIDGRVYETTE